MLNKKNILTTLIILTISIIAITGCGDDSTVITQSTPTASSTVSTISGIVYDSSGRTLDGITMTLTPLIETSESYGETQKFTTQNGGQYSFTIKYGGNYLIEAKDRETFMGSKQFSITVGENLSINFGEPGTEAALTIQVWQDEGQTIPLSGYEVSLAATTLNEESTSILEDSAEEGEVQFKNLTPGQYIITISYEEIIEKRNIYLEAGDNTEKFVLYRWYKVYDPAITFLTVYFIDSMNGWAVGYNVDGGSIAKTTDGGKSWSNSNIDGEIKTVFSVYFIDELNGYAVGYDSTGIILKTTDGGENWTVLSNVEGTSMLYSVYFSDNQTGWAAGSFKSGSSNSGIILKTIDGGNNWSVDLTYPEGWFSSVYFLNKDTGWVGGSPFLRTTDGGNTWLESTIPRNRLPEYLFYR